MENLFLCAVQRLEDAGVSDAAIEEFMARVYDPDSVGRGAAAGDPAAEFQEVIERLYIEFSSQTGTGALERDSF